MFDPTPSLARWAPAPVHPIKCNATGEVLVGTFNITSMTQHPVTLRFPGIHCIQEHQAPVNTHAKHKYHAGQASHKLDLLVWHLLCVFHHKQKAGGGEESRNRQVG